MYYSSICVTPLLVVPLFPFVLHFTIIVESVSRCKYFYQPSNTQYWYFCGWELQMYLINIIVDLWQKSKPPFHPPVKHHLIWYIAVQHMQKEIRKNCVMNRNMLATQRVKGRVSICCVFATHLYTCNSCYSCYSCNNCNNRNNRNSPLL